MQDKWRFNTAPDVEPRRCATTSRSFRSPRPTIRWSTSYPVDKNNFQPRVGLTYDLGGGTSIVRGGYGRFYDKSHFELIGGLYTGTPFTSSFTVNFPTAAADPGPRNGQFPTEPYLVNGPVINRALLEQEFPAGSCCATPARAGTTRIAGCRTPIR